MKIIKLWLRLSCMMVLLTGCYMTGYDDFDLKRTITDVLLLETNETKEELCLVTTEDNYGYAYDIIPNRYLVLNEQKEEISADGVQNPLDATMTYRYKRGQHHGHVLNVAEVCDGSGNGIIIHASVEPNTQSDSRMAEEYVSGLPEGGSKQRLITDGAYSSTALEEMAARKNVELQTTSLTGKTPEDIIADFVLNEEKTEILSCPVGNTPTRCAYNPNTESITAVMPDNCCATCPHRNECKAKVNNKKSKSTVKVTGKMITRANHARKFQSEAGKENADIRNGVEGIMSVMRRKYDLDHIPVFGLDRLKGWIWTSLLSYNLVKYKKYKLALEKTAAA